MPQHIIVTAKSRHLLTKPDYKNRIDDYVNMKIHSCQLLPLTLTVYYSEKRVSNCFEQKAGMKRKSLPNLYREGSRGVILRTYESACHKRRYMAGSA